MDTLLLAPLTEEARAGIAWDLGASMPGLGPGWWDEYPAPGDGSPSSDAEVLALAAATGGEVAVPR